MKNVLLKYLERVGNKREFKLFLDIITKIPKIKYAVIKISGATLDNNIDLIAEDIAFLNSLNIYPIIVHGAGSELDKRLPNSKKLDGIRITEEEDIAVIKNVFDEISETLCRKITQYGGSAARVETLFDCDHIEKYGFVGKITNVNVSKIEQVISQNKTPIISPLGMCRDKYMNINADTAAKEVIKQVLPHKIIILTETGGILDEEGKIISFLNPANIDQYSNITGGMLYKIKEILELLDECSDCSIVITSAMNLLKEIFTVKGSGTFIKSYKINVTSDIKSIDCDKLKKLLEDAFGKKLVNEYFSSEISEIFYEANYEGAAVIKMVNDISYLDKFAVAKQSQETGLGSAIWHEMIKKHKKLIWRVTPVNPLNAFYARESTGCMKYDAWNIYWINLSQEEIFPAIDKILKISKTII